MPYKRIILASGSPRRRELLRRAGIRFKVRRPNIDEKRKSGETPARMVARLAFEKAQSVFRRAGDSLVLAADTIVVTPNGNVLGKPRNRLHARQLLKKIRGRHHSVFTAYCILAAKSKRTRVIRTKVKIRSMSEDEISRYIRTGEPMDKAGAYAAQGVGMQFIEEIRGSYTNVVGLPVAEVLRDLRQAGYR